MLHASPYMAMQTLTTGLGQSSKCNSAQEEKEIIDYAHTLPLPLLYGIPPKMAVLPNSPWWCNDVIDDLHYHSSIACKALIGIDSRFVASSHPLVEWLAPVQHLDAKTAFRQLMSEGVVLEAPPLANGSAW